uniref:Putative peritrophin-1 n=1 Tax=Anopheles darlingi TaxID=43151 RepID=A0A2M4DFV2_ANODA
MLLPFTFVVLVRDSLLIAELSITSGESPLLLLAWSDVDDDTAVSEFSLFSISTPFSEEVEVEEGEEELLGWPTSPASIPPSTTFSVDSISLVAAALSAALSSPSPASITFPPSPFASVGSEVYTPGELLPLAVSLSVPLSPPFRDDSVLLSEGESVLPSLSDDSASLSRSSKSSSSSSSSRSLMIWPLVPFAAPRSVVVVFGGAFVSCFLFCTFDSLPSSSLLLLRMSCCCCCCC